MTGGREREREDGRGTGGMREGKGGWESDRGTGEGEDGRGTGGMGEGLRGWEERRQGTRKGERGDLMKHEV